MSTRRSWSLNVVDGPNAHKILHSGSFVVFGEASTVSFLVEVPELTSTHCVKSLVGVVVGWITRDDTYFCDLRVQLVSRKSRYVPTSPEDVDVIISYDSRLRKGIATLSVYAMKELDVNIPLQRAGGY
ncbi:MAG: hypothetical protein QG653_560 [Patescibacteria group bacterium]|nr:hypothetical protein [Patescibacteria group bacterium]